MKTLLLSLFPGISYASFVDGMASLSSQGFIGISIFGTIAFIFLINSINSGVDSNYPKSI